MGDRELVVFDGSQLGAADLSIPEEITGDISVERFLELANSRVSDCLYGLSLPVMTVSGAFVRLNTNDEQFDRDQVERLLPNYLSNLADELRAVPIVVSILDGSRLGVYLENENDYAILAESLFTALNKEDEGTVSKSEIPSALADLGVKMGVPSFSELPMIEDVLKKHEAEGVEKLDQEQFTQLLKLILQDLADALARNHIAVELDIKYANGDLPKQLSVEENYLDILAAVLYQKSQYAEEEEEEQSFAEMMKDYLKENGTSNGIPPLEDSEDVIRLYDAVFSDIGNNVRAKDLEKDELRDLATQTLQKFAVELEAKPVFYGSSSN